MYSGTEDEIVRQIEKEQNFKQINLNLAVNEISQYVTRVWSE